MGRKQEMMRFGGGGEEGRGGGRKEIVILGKDGWTERERERGR